MKLACRGYFGQLVIEADSEQGFPAMIDEYYKVANSEFYAYRCFY